MMNIPKKIKIGAITYDIEICEVVSRDNHNTDGQIIYDEQKIKLAQRLEGNYKEEVFLHEVIHGLLQFNRLENSEDICERITKTLHMIIIDNPGIFGGGEPIDTV